MNSFVRLISAIILMSSIFSQAEQLGSDTIRVNSNQKVINQLIIKYKTTKDGDTGYTKPGKGSIPEHALANMARSTGHQIKYLRQTGLLDTHVVSINRKVNRQKAKEIAASILSTDSTIEYVEPDYQMTAMRVPNDQYFNSYFWNLKDGDNGGINAVGAWDITTGNPATVIAVIDTGILPHRDLDPDRILTGYDFISDPVRAKDGDGRDNNPTDEGDWALPGDDCYTGFYPKDKSSWHGLFVTGIIGAASNNDYGMAGMDWQARILPLRVLGTCGGQTSDITDAILWAAGYSVAGVPDNTHPADVINLSLGVNEVCSKSMQTAITKANAAGAIVVAAAGNDAIDVAGVSPAGCEQVITVGAAGYDGTMSYYSNIGEEVDILAPGGRSNPNSRDLLVSLSNLGDYQAAGESFYFKSGTSIAAPQISGLIALMLDQVPEMQYEDIVQIFQMPSVTRPLANGDPCYDMLDQCGPGIADAYQAIKAATLVPVAPSDLTLQLISGTIEINWTDNSSIETGFLIEKSIDNESFVPVMITGPNITRFIDDDMSADAGLYYRVSAIKGSFISSAISAYIATLAAPEGVTVEHYSANHVLVSWLDNSDAETSYLVYRSESPDQDYKLILNAPANTTGIIDASISGGTTYYYKVSLAIGDTSSGYSETVSVTTRGNPNAGSPAAWPLALFFVIMLGARILAARAEWVMVRENDVNR